ncbi:copper resistance protein B [Pseudomonas profundi]|uniref:copper resistance protein B n=1 Tax=Pseudomonas profundi TaxID=1981513 RepID=UPI0037C74365
MNLCKRNYLTRNALKAALLLSIVPVQVALGAEEHGEHHGTTMDHEPVQQDVDHSQMQHHPAEHDEVDHSQMGHGSSGLDRPDGVLPAFIPALTDADRAAAFPAIQGHTVHDKVPFGLLLFDQLEYQNADAGSVLAWEVSGWWGGDIDRLWVRSEGERTNGVTEDAELQLLWGHAIGPWWEVVGGVRQDFKPGSPQTWAALGVQGMALYGLEVQATGYLGEGGQTAARLEGEYDILLTNRLVLQPVAELSFYGKDDPARGVGSGLSKLEAGLRLRYEIVREFAPYIGVSWGRSFGETADIARQEGEKTEEARFVAGVRMWF